MALVASLLLSSMGCMSWEYKITYSLVTAGTRPLAVYYTPIASAHGEKMPDTSISLTHIDILQKNKCIFNNNTKELDPDIWDTVDHPFSPITQ